MSKPTLEVAELEITYSRPHREKLLAVREVSFTVWQVRFMARRRIGMRQDQLSLGRSLGAFSGQLKVRLT